MPDEHLKHLGAIAIALVSLALFWMVRKFPQGRGTSISQHAAARRHTYFVFASVLTLAGATFWVFLLRWFGPALQTPKVFYLFLLVGAVCQFITAWVPDSGKGRRSTTHRYAAFAMAFMMMLLTGCIIVAQNVTLAARIVAAAVFLFMGVFWCLFLFFRASHRHFLVYQSCYIAGFYIAVLMATYIYHPAALCLPA